MEKATSVLLIHPVTAEVLTATRRNCPDQFGLIGGKIDPGETIEDCAMREFAEETGIALSSPLKKVFTGTSELASSGKWFEATAFLVVDVGDIMRVASAFKVPREVEPGIIIGFNRYQKVIDGPFGMYNAALLGYLMSQSQAIETSLRGISEKLCNVNERTR